MEKMAKEDEAVGKSDEVVGKSEESEFLKRWSQRIEKKTDDSALKSRLLEGLVDAYRTPASVLPDRDLRNFLSAMKNQFVEGDLTPVQFLEKMQSLLRCSE